MAKWVVLLRGVNVGGHKKIPMAELREVLSNTGFDSVQTYIQSGNIVLDSALESNEIGPKISSVIEVEFGFTVELLVRSGEEFMQAVENVPFGGDQGDAKLVHLVFHDCEPQDVNVVRIEELAAGDDYAFGKGVFYLHTPQGFSKSKLAERIATCFRRPVTARNLNSCRKITKLVRA